MNTFVNGKRVVPSVGWRLKGCAGCRPIVVPTRSAPPNATRDKLNPPVNNPHPFARHD